MTAMRLIKVSNEYISIRPRDNLGKWEMFVLKMKQEENCYMFLSTALTIKCFHCLVADVQSGLQTLCAFPATKG